MDLSLNSNVNYETFKRGDVLFKEGAKHDKCFIVSSGKIALVKKYSKRDNVFYVTKEKDIIGEDSVLSKEKVYHYSAVVLDDVEVIPMIASEVKAVVENHAEWISNILNNISAKIFNSIEMISEHRISDDELYNGYQITEDDLVTIKNSLT